MSETTSKTKDKSRLRTLMRPDSFIRFMATRLFEDQVTRVAASLSFTTTLAVVPALALVFAMITAFPAFENVRSGVQEAIFNNFLPSTSIKMSEQLGDFVSAAGRVTAFGVIGLAVTSILLLLTIESAFNRIFRVKKPRPFHLRILVLWAVITVGPFLFAISFTAFGAFGTSMPWQDKIDRGVREALLGQFVPLLFSWLALTFIYTIVPNRRIRFRDAMYGAAFSAVMFAGLRYGFALYVGYMTDYEAVYGAVAALPVFLVWVYLCWTMVLIGAGITATLPEWRHVRLGGSTSTVDQVSFALDLIGKLAAAQRRGGGMSMDRLVTALAIPDLVTGELLDVLKSGRFVAVTDDGIWILSRDLDRTPLADLLELFGLGLTKGGGSATSELGRKLAGYIQRAAESERTILSVSLAKIVSLPDATDAEKSEAASSED
ncbi:MAG: YihY family inner membrane protein [Rhodobacteraceae bacterium]|nr:YihY family inner membrane protein [Paracoccaceae bacterium]